MPFYDEETNEICFYRESAVVKALGLNSEKAHKLLLILKTNAKQDIKYISFSGRGEPTRELCLSEAALRTFLNRIDRNQLVSPERLQRFADEEGIHTEANGSFNKMIDRCSYLGGLE
jgi:hypothetical protein